MKELSFDSELMSLLGSDASLRVRIEHCFDDFVDGRREVGYEGSFLTEHFFD